MAKVVSPIAATVEYITAIKSGEYGDYRSVLFLDNSGEKIWKSFDPESEELALLSKGVRVQLIPITISKSGKQSHTIVLLDAPTTLNVPAVAPAQVVQASGWSNEQEYPQRRTFFWLDT